MKKASWLALVYALVVVTGVSAQESKEKNKNAEGKSSIKIDQATGKKNKVDGDIDEEITNPRLRAESGSKSKFSLSTSVAYTGGSISRAFGKDRPNIKGNEPGQQVRTSADIGLDVRYRWSKNDSLTVGTSMGMMTPFQGNTDSTQKQFNIYDPAFGYARIGKVGSIQMSTGVGLGIGTSNESKSIRKIADLGVSVTGLHSFQNGLAVGLSTAVGYNFYGNNAGEATDVRTASPGFYGGDRRTEWSLGVFPFAEYQFNDYIAARTVFGYFNWRHLYGDTNSSRLLQLYVYQSLGVGITLTRDIYLYPNIQFLPDNVRSDFTNFAMSATLNVF